MPWMNSIPKEIQLKNIKGSFVVEDERSGNSERTVMVATFK